MKMESPEIDHNLPGKKGSGRLSTVFRVAARHGMAPARGCNQRVKHVNEHQRQILHFINDGESLPGTMIHALEHAGYEIRFYASADEILESQRAGLRGCFILDIHLPGGENGLDLQAELIRRNCHLPIIFLTDHGDISMSVKATKSGAFDFLTKQTSHEDFLSSVAAAMREESELWDIMQKGMNLKRRWETLTQCERQVFGGVVSGMTNKQIGGKVGSTERTIRAHRASMMQKMGVHSVAELVHQAQELGVSMDVG